MTDTTNPAADMLQLHAALEAAGDRHNVASKAFSDAEGAFFAKHKAGDARPQSLTDLEQAQNAACDALYEALDVFLAAPADQLHWLSAKLVWLTRLRGTVNGLEHVQADLMRLQESAQYEADTAREGREEA